MSNSPTPQIAPQGSYWHVELWRENRELFKEIVRHIAFFGIPIGSISGFHRLLDITRIPLEEAALLNKVHFYTYIILLLIFAVSFAIKVVYWELAGIRR